MKQIFNFLLVCTILLSTSVFAEGILCSRDNRWVSGAYQEMKLEKINGLFNLTETIISISGETKTRVIAKNIDCNVDSMVAFCFRNAAEAGDTQNTTVKFSIVQKTEINSLHQDHASKTDPQMIIEVDSSLLPTRKDTFIYGVVERFGGCKNI